VNPAFSLLLPAGLKRRSREALSQKSEESLFLEGQLGHVYSLADNCVLVNARANVCDYLKDWCNGAVAFFRERIIDDFSSRYREMLVALDLRVLILPQAESVVKEQLSALKKLWIWSCRILGVGGLICQRILR
jgi:hypothetical protein